MSKQIVRQFFSAALFLTNSFAKPAGFHFSQLRNAQSTLQFVKLIHLHQKVDAVES